jgi:predicted phosphodiesterase
MQLAFFGGVYNNSLALEAAIRDARERGVERLYCLGDLGAFGPYPDRVFPLLFENDVICIQGNYDHSIGHDLDDCQCGYTDPRDNHFAQISYEYTYENTSQEHRRWLRELPTELRFEVDGLRFLLCHGSPRRTNEFLWESTTSTAFLEKLADEFEADVILATHTGIHWQRELSGGRRFINVGCLGRPENDGRTNVWYTIVRTGRDADGAIRDAGCAIRGASGRMISGTAGLAPRDSHRASRIAVDTIPLAYDHERLARQMRDEKLPDEFIETILTGWWTSCLEVLPAKERRRGKY